MISRRGLLQVMAGGAAGMLGGCGFRPLYLPESASGSVAGAELAAVYVPVEGERTGQLLRQALQRRLEGTGTGVVKKYELTAAMIASQEGIAIQRDNSTTRIRLVASGPWSLRAYDVAHTLLSSGSSRVVDGFNILNQQYFAADLENEAAYRRVAEALADQIVLQVGIFLRRRAVG